jgi:hypothetical protein
MHVEGTGSLFISNKQRADYQVCKQEADAARANSRLAQENCKQTIRRMSRAPTTIQWGGPFGGINAPRRTDGGFAVNIQGSDADGSFSVTCYMDENYIVTNIR